MKKELLSPPTLMAPIPRRPLILYLSETDTSLGLLLAQEDNEGSHINLCRIMLPTKQRYSKVEKGVFGVSVCDSEMETK